MDSAPQAQENGTIHVLDVDCILIPIHIKEPPHWVRAMVDIENKLVVFMDSLGVRTLYNHVYFVYMYILNVVRVLLFCSYRL